MVVARRPLRSNGSKAHCLDVRITFLFPVGTSVRMPVQCLEQTTHGPTKVGQLLSPPIGAGFRRKTNPRRVSLHVSLDIGLFGISNLNHVIRQAAKEIDSLSRLQCRRRTSQILKDRVVVILIINLAALKNNTAFKLSSDGSSSALFSTQMPKR